MNLSIAFITNQHIVNQRCKMATTMIWEYIFNNLSNAPISFVILRAQSQGTLSFIIHVSVNKTSEYYIVLFKFVWEI